MITKDNIREKLVKAGATKVAEGHYIFDMPDVSILGISIPSEQYNVYAENATLSTPFLGEFIIFLRNRGIVLEDALEQVIKSVVTIDNGISQFVTCEFQKC